MKNKIYLSLVCVVALNATDLGTINVIQDVTDTKVIENVSNEEVKSADLAEAISKQIPSINLIRRSGIANDITLRGQKRDNIVITVDGAKVCGACPNRMDPPTSHIVTANVDTVKVSEGPFDVEEFGDLSGEVKVTTKKPSKQLKGELETTFGSYGYKKFGAKISGGNDKVQALVSASSETSEQYKDGDGNTIAEQLQHAVVNTPQAGMQYADKYKDMDAYTKKTAMGKVFVKVTDNQKLEASVTANRSDDVLYGNSKMDAIYDDSNIYNFKYTIDELNQYSNKLTIKMYKSDVEHPMSTKYRMASGANSANEVISKLTTDMTGLKIINDMKLGSDLLSVGIDSSKRNWDGIYIGYGVNAGITNRPSIEDVDTKNNAIFAKYNKDIGNIQMKFGARYNDTTISTSDSSYSDKTFNSFDLNLVATLKVNDDMKYFMALGKASRVPDGRELYFKSKTTVMVGTPNLDQTTNNEIDLGFEHTSDNGYLKIKTFYSKLDNYIYFHKGLTKNNFENIDAVIYGLEVLGSKDLTDMAYIDFGISYKKGKKDKAMQGQTDKDLADITPLKVTMALNYDIDDSLSTKFEFIHANSWDNYDADNGEQALPSYNIINIKANKEFNKQIEMTLGIDNLFDKTYAVSNTYADLILLSDGTSSEVMLLNESGRYIYANVKYKF